MNHTYYVYIITNYSKSVLCTGRTNNLEQRLVEHYSNRGLPKTFAGRYHCFNLLHFEQFQYINDAIYREKEIKGWKREKKIALIKKENPELKFLNNEVMEWPPDYLYHR